MTSAIARNRVNVAGRGKQAIIFAHGFGSDQDDWRHIAPRFERDYKVVRYDLAGCGGTDLGAYDREKYQSLQGHASDLLDIVKELKLTQPLFVGHDAGAMVGVLAAVREPYLFSKLALVASSPHYIDEPGYFGGAPLAQIQAVVSGLEADFASWCENVVPFALGYPDKPQLSAELVSAYQRMNADVAKHFAHAMFFSDLRTALPYVRDSTLVVQSPQDAFVPEEVGRYLTNAIPDCELVMLKTLGHYPHHAGADELASVLHRWAAS